MSKCAVIFCGTPGFSEKFDEFYSNVEKITAVEAQQILALTQVVEKTKDLERGVLILLLTSKSDVANMMIVLAACKKKNTGGTLRVLAFNLIQSDKVAHLLKSKGCADTFTEELTQKALLYKLQKQVQIANAKRRRPSAAAESGSSDAAAAGKNRLKFVRELQDPDDCWLVKSKQDFKFVRDHWIGEMIGPGPSAGSWVEAGANTQQPHFRWEPRKKEEIDQFVPDGGSWFFSGRKPEFDWKISRWRFVGEAPSLYYRAVNASKDTPPLFRFRSTGPGALEVALNSIAAKGKLRMILETFASEKVFKKDGKGKKKFTDEDLAIGKEPEGGKDSEGEIAQLEEVQEWGSLEDAEDAEEETGDWSGLDTGRGNKFNSGRGVGQGGGGSKGYTYEEEKEGTFTDRTDEGEAEEQHDWTGLDVGRENKFTSGRGLSQGTGTKGYKYEKEAKGNRRSESEDGADFEDLENIEEIEEFDADADAVADEEGVDAEDGGDFEFEELPGTDDESSLEADRELDELLGDPAAEKEWKVGAHAFERITLDISVSRPDAPGAALLGDVSLLERKDSDLLLDAPASSFALGERVGFTVILGNAGETKKIQLTGLLKSIEPSGEGREIILVNVTDVSRPHLLEIAAVFEQRQVQLLKFLRESKGRD